MELCTPMAFKMRLQFSSQKFSVFDSCRFCQFSSARVGRWRRRRDLRLGQRPAQ